MLGLERLMVAAFPMEVGGVDKLAGLYHRCRVPRQPDPERKARIMAYGGGGPATLSGP